MAYPSSRGGSARAPARGGRPVGRSGGSRGGGGGSNLTIWAVCAVVLVLGIGAILLLKGKKTPPKEEPMPAGATVVKPPPKVAPPTSTEKPYKPLPDSFLLKGRELAKTFEQDARDGETLYAESVRLKDGDRGAWQRKLDEAIGKLEPIKDRWNDFINSLPHDPNHDSEEVARHFFPRENGRVADMTKKLAAVKTDKGMR